MHNFSPFSVKIYTNIRTKEWGVHKLYTLGINQLWICIFYVRMNYFKANLMVSSKVVDSIDSKVLTGWPFSLSIFFDKKAKWRMAKWQSHNNLFQNGKQILARRHFTIELLYYGTSFLLIFV